jgi:DNA primase
MSKTKIKILKEILGDYTKTGNEYLFYCLFCKHHKRKLSINLDKNKMKCWVCDVAGDISRLVKRNGTFLQQQDWKELTGQVEISDFEKVLFGQKTVVEESEQSVSLPDEFVSLCNQNTSLTAVQARNYLAKRGIDKADILKWKLGYCSSGQYAGRIIAPSFNVEGKVNYFIARTYEGNWKKYMNPPDSKDIVFNELYVDWDDDIVLVEGVFDAVKVPNSIPILGSTLREDSKLFKQIIKNDPAVYLALDPDAEKKAHVLIDSLMKYGIEVYTVPIKPFKDAGEMSKEEFLRRKKNATLVNSTDNLLMQRILAI